MDSENLTDIRHASLLREESETNSEESDVSSSNGVDSSWISWFCSLRGNEFFCKVDEDYIRDDFNLCGLSNQVPYYGHALDLIRPFIVTSCYSFSHTNLCGRLNYQSLATKRGSILQ
ncbi:hypothetical protein ACET3Z_013631 [Daucus carota]